VVTSITTMNSSGARSATYTPPLSARPRGEDSEPKGVSEIVGMGYRSRSRSSQTFAAGTKIPKIRKVKTIPAAAASPKSCVGGNALVRFDRNPMAEVPMTMKNATVTWLVVSSIDRSIPRPRTRSSR
jgi:hypothetical protein